jgi:predicted nucleic-acid-binding protein
MKIPRRLVDTNLIIRHLVQDHKEHSTIASRLFSASDNGLVVLAVIPPVLAECVFVLESFYEQPRQAITDALRLLILSPGVECQDRSSCLDALQLYSRTKLHFVDCLVAARAVEDGIAVATFDKGIRKLPEVVVAVEVDEK